MAAAEARAPQPHPISSTRSPVARPPCAARGGPWPAGRLPSIGCGRPRTERTSSSSSRPATANRTGCPGRVVGMDVLAAAAARLSAKAMSPERSALVQAPQLWRATAAAGPWAVPKRRVLPSGHWTDRLPCPRQSQQAQGSPCAKTVASEVPLHSSGLTCRPWRPARRGRRTANSGCRRRARSRRGIRCPRRGWRTCPVDPAA